jgi:hypothetical protein
VVVLLALALDKTIFLNQKQLHRMKVAAALIFICLAKCFLAQTQELVFVSTIKQEKDVQKIYDSLRIPLLIYQNKIYAIHSECITRDFGGNINSRDSGGNSNDRNAAGNSSDRNSGGDAKERNSGGNSNDRNSSGNTNDRNVWGNTNDRSSGGNSNDRNASGNSKDREAGGSSKDRNQEGAFSKFMCSVDQHGKLILHFYNIMEDKSTKVYYNNSYISLKSKYFIIKKI